MSSSWHASGERCDKYPAFDPFWKELQHQLRTYKMVHSRSYGSDRSYLSFAMSIRSMVEKIKKAVEAIHAPSTLQSVGFEILSKRHVGMQFAPKNKKNRIP